MYLRRCDSDRCATERALRRSRTADSASWDHQALGERPRRPKGIEALEASTKKREKEWAAWWMLSASNQEREGAQQCKIGKYPTGLFVVEFGGTSVWVTNWREGEDNFNGEMVRAKARESAPLTVGSERHRS